MSGKLVFVVSLAESVRAKEKNHRGTEGTEKGWDLCLCGSVPLCFKRHDRNVVPLNALG